MEHNLRPCLPTLAAFAAVLAVLLPPALTAPASLQILDDAYPRVFFFRQSEGVAARGNVTFEQWDQTFSRLMGLMGKALDEEVPGRSRNLEFFTRFKQAHPDQAVLLHFNGNARDPRWESQRFFAGHWLYFNGATILSEVPADEKETVLHVADSSLFRMAMGRYRNANEDIGLCRLGPDGRPDWRQSEQVQLLAVDRSRNTIRIRRGCYGTSARAFAAGQAYAAAHCTEGPWGKNSNLLWYYNYATTCPPDARGRSCADIQVEHLGELFGPGGALAAFDGLEFDVLSNSHGTRGNERGPDTDADGQADGGVVNGVNVYGAGVIAFCRQLRAKLGERRIMQADGATRRNTSQRAFRILNGIESEGWPGLWDKEVRDWSGGLNRHFFWGQNARPPVFNYINHKFVEPGVEPGVEKRSEVPFNIHRLVFAAGVFTDSAICYSYAPPGGSRGEIPIWDEFVMGTENRLGWLGRPLGSAVRLAAREPDLLLGVGQPAGHELLRRFTSDDARLELDGGGVKLSGKKPDAAQFRVRLKAVPCRGPDLFVSVTARAAAMKRQPAEMARLLYVGIALSADHLVRPDPPPSTGMSKRGEAETALGFGAGVRFEPQVKLGADARAAYFVHPPYTAGASGYAYWERRVAVPENGELEFFTGLSANGATKGDGVTFIVQVAGESGGQTGVCEEIWREHEQSNQWTRHTLSLTRWAGQTVRLKFISDCGPGNNTVADQSYWGDVRIRRAGEAAEGETPVAQYGTWMNAKDFTSGFYFNDIRSRQVDLEFVVESSEPVWLSDLTVHAHPDTMCREFEHGLVIANPSPRRATVDLSRLFPGQSFRRIKATPQQDTRANNGESVGARLTLAPQEGLFLIKD